MLKIIILFLLVLIIYFVLRTRKGLSKIDKIFNKENLKDMKQLQLEIQKKINDNKIKKNK